MLFNQTDSSWVISRDLYAAAAERSSYSNRRDVAFPIHEYQVKQGVQKWIYHRPAHGQGMEGHQPPYLALGDHTVLDTGMCFSVEPGLFDPENGVGSKFSDLFVVEPAGPSLGPEFRTAKNGCGSGFDLN